MKLPACVLVLISLNVESGGFQHIPLENWLCRFDSKELLIQNLTFIVLLLLTYVKR